MEEKATILKVVIQIVGFSILGCSVIATFLESSSKKKEIPNQIHNGKKASKNITCAGKEVTVKPSKNITCAGKEPSKNITCAGKEPSKNIACAGKEPSKNITCAGKEVTLMPSKNITCAGKEPSKNITCAGKEPSKNIACAGKEPSKNITCAGKEVTVTPSKNNINQAMEIYFPMEIVMDILSRLPVRSLMRFKCVSKSWKTLISEPCFNAKHWKHGKNNQKFLISSLCPKVGRRLFHSSSLSSVQSVGDVQKLGCPSIPCCYSIQCCCNGLSLLYSGDDLLLWNPSTNESVVLPIPELPPLCFTYGMGYDSTSDDYKILLIDNAGYGNGPESYPNILALKSGSWRKIDKHPRAYRNYANDKDPLAFLHGAFHWISVDIFSSVSSMYFISSLAISNEVYGDIPLPEGFCNLFNLSYMIRDLSVLGGLLCAHCTCRDNTELGTFKLWVMKDYGVKESWIELISIRETYFYLVTPRYMFPDGEVLLYDDANSYFWFWTSKGSFRLLLAPSPFYQGFIYTESLVSPKLLTCRE